MRPRLLAVLIFLFFVWAFGRAIDAEAHYSPGPHNVRHALNLAWCGKANRYCEASEDAWKIVGCETGFTYSPWARNGQYLGILQVSKHWRDTFSGFRFNVWAQARHGHKVYVATGGWSHWECAYRMGVL